MATKGGGLRFQGSVTSDGVTGLFTVNLVIPAAASKARGATGWKVTRAVIGNAGAAPMTAATVTLKDNAGAGQTILTFTQATDGTKKELTAPVGSIVGNLQLGTPLSVGLSKTCEYFVEVS